MWQLFDTAGYPPAYSCSLAYTPALRAALTIGDGATGLAYMAIPALIVAFVLTYKSGPIGLTWLWLLAAFVSACGLNHLCNVLMFYWPAYRLLALVKLCMAAISWAALIGLVPAIRQILHARTAEDVLASEARLSEIIDTAINAFIEIDASGKVLRWNVSAEKMFGWTKQEAIGRRLEELIIPDHLHVPHAQGVARQLASATPLQSRRLESTARRKDGTEFPVEISMVQVHTPTGIGFAAFIRDLSERTELVDKRHVLAKLPEEAKELRRLTKGKGSKALLGVITRLEEMAGAGKK